MERKSARELIFLSTDTRHACDSMPVSSYYRLKKFQFDVSFARSQSSLGTKGRTSVKSEWRRRNARVHLQVDARPDGDEEGLRSPLSFGFLPRRIFFSSGK